MVSPIIEKNPPLGGHLRLRPETSQRKGRQRVRMVKVRTGGRAGALLAHVVVHGEDFAERVFVRIDVDHPAKDDRLEAPIRGVAGFLRGDRSLQSKLFPIRDWKKF